MNPYQQACGKVAMKLMIVSGILLTVFILVNQPPKLEERKPWIMIGFQEIK
jgi:hypothetical protein